MGDTYYSKYFGTGEELDEALHKAPMHDYGTEDLIAGSSPLESGKPHFACE